MLDYQAINPEDYTYHLPDERIAKFPLANRHDAQLLHYNGGTIQHHVFKQAAALLPAGSQLFLNNTRVIQARLFFRRQSGALIEVFLLEPVAPTRFLEESMECRQTVTWQCMVRNLKKWKDGETLYLEVPTTGLQLRATLEARQPARVRFEWQPATTPFKTVLQEAGKIPLPPYLNREATEADALSYQTVYAAQEGAVAAPTAGLHFTDEVLAQLAQKQVVRHQLTLHVSAGTFQPLKASNVADHPMHTEQVIIPYKTVQYLATQDQDPVVAVGTTSVRTLESAYWYGVMLGQDAKAVFKVPSLYPYEHGVPTLPGRKEAFARLLAFMDTHGLMQLVGETSLFIMPGYHFKVVNAMFTNFHLPGSTLILLVAAFIGQDWEKVYQEALENNYRFLSYGDGSLLWPA